MFSCCSSTPQTPTVEGPKPEEQIVVHRPSDPTAHPAVIEAEASRPEVAGPGPLHLTMVVIGKVEATTARVLLEILEGGRVTCQLRCVQRDVRMKHTLIDGTSDQVKPAITKLSPNDPGYQVVESTQMLEPGKPKIFKFSGLYPDARYEVFIKDLAHLQPSSQFRTLLENWTITPDKPTMKFAAVSCNLLSETLALKETQADLWAELALRAQNDELDYVLHMGDQVYADEFRSDEEIAAPASAFAPDTHAAEGAGGEKLEKVDQLVFRKALKLLEGKDRSEWPSLIPQIEELYRQLYRETWGHKPTAVLLANVPNLSVLDDHDYVDNWGQLPHGRDKDRSSPDFFVALRARQVYWEYQGSLSRDIDMSRFEENTKDHHFHVFGEYGVIMTESRGAGSFRYSKDDPTPFLGAEQWRDLEAAMAPGGMMERVKHLLIVCPCPVVYLPHGLNGFIEPMVEDAQGHWASAQFRDEQTRMLNLALAWQEGQGFGQRLKEIEPSPKPTAEAENVDIDPKRKVHLTRFPSLAGVNFDAMDGHTSSSSSSSSTSSTQVSSYSTDEKKDPNAQIPTIPAPSNVSSMRPSPCVSDRRVTFLGGDVHVGGHTRFFKDGHHVMDQLVSSAISNHILPTLAFKIGQAMQNAYTQLADGWSFEHQGFTKNRNFGMVETIRPISGDAKNAKPKVCTYIVSAE